MWNESCSPQSGIMLPYVLLFCIFYGQRFPESQLISWGTFQLFIVYIETLSVRKTDFSFFFTCAKLHCEYSTNLPLFWHVLRFCSFYYYSELVMCFLHSYPVCSSSGNLAWCICPSTVLHKSMFIDPWVYLSRCIKLPLNVEVKCCNGRRTS